MRYLRPLLVYFLVTILVVPVAAEASRGGAPRTGLNDPRYAALIMNPQTGEIYHSRNADSRRYPASLTKMMTLYLLFEALEQKKISLSSKLDVSKYATTMPQTNLSLSTSDEIPVDTAIKALVVRSANDVAVVVAENLGGSVQNFAARMTAKAHALGMNNTVFKNPNGLPNDAQYTTARDMAKLGIALKRDFPQYYSYFAVRQFSWKGSTYYTHNRVMLRYSGTDGIKTGFINKSGFNVVTSCSRGGRALLGVVMGGTSANWRDSQMIALLDQGYKVIAGRGQQSGRIYAANLPLPRAGTAPAAPPATQMAAATAPVANAAVVTPSAPVRVATAAPAAPVAVANIPADRGIIHQQETMLVRPAAIPEPKPSMPMVLGGGLTQPGQVEAVWGIQVGAFSSQALAEQAVRQAFAQASNSLQGSKMSVIGAGQPGSTIHRARLENLSENQARKACEVLISHNSPCFIFRADAQNL